MACLAATNYDPTTTTVSGSTAALKAMTALDTTNLRLNFTVPQNGSVLVKLRGTVQGATTFPRILLGVLEGATVRMRMTPMGQYSGTAVATTHLTQEAVGLVTGLTPGANLNWDAAYGVEIVLASTNLKYGGNTILGSNTAFGGFDFEIWETINLLGGKLYDPSSAATIATTSLSTMAAMDTTNLRQTVIAPASGNIMWRLHTQYHGATTFPQLLLGVMEGASVVARCSPIMGNTTTPLATSCVAQAATGVITGLTPGSSHTYDAAFSTQVVASAGGIKHGGPNDTTTNNAFGGTAFELWAA